MHKVEHGRKATQGCPCGFYNDHIKPCTCTPHMIHKYLQRISGPLLDRIDIHVEVPRLKQNELMSKSSGESSTLIRDRVKAAREIQNARLTGSKIFCNAQMNTRQMKLYCKLNADAESMLKQAIEHLRLSARAFDRILKLSRTIADLSCSESIGIEHVAEAVQYRSLDRKYWG
ncbi:MAG: ATP-binding protein [Armatimonadetes bacterium]|nr:ATP-binding protein [Armatimonadota bacterium]